MARVAPAKILAGLKKVAPNIAITTEWEEDPNFVWDGDGPDPAEDGYVAYDVDVFARAIVDGETIEGRGSLGGTYARPGEQDPDVSGYFAQMVEEALGELADQTSGAIKKQATDAKRFMKDVMSQNYAASRRRR